MESKSSEDNPGQGAGEGAIEGGCLCGAVRYVITPPTIWCAHCHCSMCRRAHGAAFVTWAGVPSQSFRIVAGEDRLTRFHSSKDSTRSFCGACGSPMLFESARWPGEVHVAVGSITGRLDKAPMAHAFFSDRVEWIHVGDGLPRMGGPTGMEPIPT